MRALCYIRFWSMQTLKKNYDIIILEREISNENKLALKGYERGKKNVSIRFCQPTDLFSGINIKSMELNYPLEVYFKILAPFVLRNYRKLVVLDSDTILKRDIADLFETDLDGFSVGAVTDIVWHGFYRNDINLACNGNIKEYCRNILTMKNPFHYVNSGVLLFDAEKYRQELSVEKILDTAKSAPFEIADQDILNLLMEERIMQIDPAWNVYLPVNPAVCGAIEIAPVQDRERFEKAYDQPYLLHWAAKPKPWEWPDVICGGDWWQVAMETPFVGGIIARMIDYMIHRNEYYANNKYNRVPELWSMNPLCLDPNRHKKIKP